MVPGRSGAAGATGLAGEAPMAGTASCLRLALWHGYLGHLGGVWVWGTAERWVEVRYGVEGAEGVAVCGVSVSVVAVGSSVDRAGERAAGEGEVETEVAVGCVG